MLNNHNDTLTCMSYDQDLWCELWTDLPRAPKGRVEQRSDPAWLRLNTTATPVQYLGPSAGSTVETVYPARLFHVSSCYVMLMLRSPVRLSSFNTFV